MLVRQINVFLENQSGRLAEVTRTLGQNNVDIRALYIADTTEYGILRMILDKPDQAVDILTKAGFTVSSTPVIAIRVSDGRSRGSHRRWARSTSTSRPPPSARR